MNISREVCLSNDLSNLVQAFDDMINSVGSASNAMEDIDLDTTASGNNESQLLSYQNKVGGDQQEHEENNVDVLNAEVKDENKLVTSKSDDCVKGKNVDDGDISRKIEDESMCSVFSKDQDNADEKITEVIKDDNTSIEKLKSAEEDSNSEIIDSEMNKYPFVKILTNDKTASFLSQLDCLPENANINNAIGNDTAITNAKEFVNTNDNAITNAIDNDNAITYAIDNDNAITNAIDNDKAITNVIDNDNADTNAKEESLECAPSAEFEFDEESAGDLLDPKDRLGDLRKDSLVNMMEWDSTFEGLPWKQT